MIGSRIPRLLLHSIALGMAGAAYVFVDACFADVVFFWNSRIKRDSTCSGDKAGLKSMDKSTLALENRSTANPLRVRIMGPDTPK